MSDVRATLCGIADQQQTNRGLVDSSNLPNNQDTSVAGYLPSFAPTFATLNTHKENVPLDSKDMHNWKKPPLLQYPSAPPRFHGNEPVSHVVENLLEQDPTDRVASGNGRNKKAIGRNMRGNNQAHQMTGRSLPSDVTNLQMLQGSSANHTLQDIHQRQGLVAGDNNRRFYPLMNTQVGLLPSICMIQKLNKVAYKCQTRSTTK